MSGSKHLGIAIDVKTSSGLLAEAVGGNHATYQRRAGGPWLMGQAVHGLAQQLLRIHADQVEQFQWPHGVAERSLDRRIDVRRLGDALFDQPDGVVVERDQEVVED